MPKEGEQRQAGKFGVQIVEQETDRGHIHIIFAMRWLEVCRWIYNEAPAQRREATEQENRSVMNRDVNAARNILAKAMAM